MYAISPLRYPGAKWRLENFVTAIMKDNKSGGASLALSLLLNGTVSEIHLNDLDRSVFAFLKSITEYSDDLIKRIVLTPVTMDVWFTQREILDKCDHNYNDTQQT